MPSRAAERVGFPVVLKGVAEGVAHKSELGLVHVGLRDADAVAAGLRGHSACGNVVVQAMVRGDLEAIAGVTRADGVGLVLLAGLGGIHAEALRDVCLWPIPVVARRHRGAVAARQPRPRAARARAGNIPTRRTRFMDLLMALQDRRRGLGDRLQAIDVNPVILGASGAIAVDALVVPAS